MGRTLREVLIGCGKVRVPEFDVPDAPEATRLARVGLYRPSCCGLQLDDAEEL